MPKIKLISENASLTYRKVTLTQENPIAEVSAEIAMGFMATGKVEVIYDADENGHEVDVPCADDEAVDVEGHVDEDGEAHVDSDIEAELAACHKVADFKALADRYGIDISECINNAQRKEVIIASFEL